MHVMSKKTTLLWLLVKLKKKNNRFFQCKQGKKFLEDPVGDVTKNKTKQPLVAEQRVFILIFNSIPDCGELKHFVQHRQPS